MSNLRAKQTECNLTETEAIAQAKGGDVTAFEYLYKAHCKRVYGVCLRIIRNPADWEPSPVLLFERQTSPKHQKFEAHRHQPACH